MSIVVFLQGDDVVAGFGPALVPSPANHVCESGSSRALVLATDRPWCAII